MNELTDLRDGWGQPEAPSRAAHSAARAALLQQATAARTQTRQPARLAATGPGERPLKEAQPGGLGLRRTGWLVGGVGLTAAAAVAAAVITGGLRVAPTATTGNGGHRHAHLAVGPGAISKLSGRQILLDAANVAAAAPATTGKYWYLKQQFPRSTAIVKNGHWDTRGLISWYNHHGAQYDLTNNNKDVYLAAPGPFSVGGSNLTYAQIEKLPTSAAGLTKWFIHSAKHSAPTATPGPPPQAITPRQSVSEIRAGLWASLEDLLYQVPAPPAVRAAAFRALAAMPNVTKIGQTGDNVILRASEPPMPANKFPPGKEPANTGVFTMTIDTSNFTIIRTTNYTGTTVILAARWTNSLPPVVPVP